MLILTRRTRLVLIIVLLVAFLMLLLRVPAPDITQSIANLRAKAAPHFDSLNQSIRRENRFFDSIQYLIDSRQFHGANLVIDSLLRIHPKNDRFLILKGKLFYAQKNYDSAMYYFNYTDSININSGSGVGKAEVYLQLKEYGQAIAEYRKLYYINSDFSLSLADVFVLNRQKDSALKYYNIYLSEYTDSVFNELQLQGIKVYPPDSVRRKIDRLKMVTHTNFPGCDKIFDSLSNKTVYYKYEEEPLYKSGFSGMVKFVFSNFDIAENEPWQSSFLITFVVDKEGFILAPRIEGKHVYEYTSGEREMIRVFKKMPRWEPGKCDHLKISCLAKVPFIIDPAIE